MTDKIMLDDAAAYGYSIKAFLVKRTHFLHNLSRASTNPVH